MNRKSIGRRSLALSAGLALFGASGAAQAAPITSNIPIAGNFSATIGVAGTATLNSASGNFKQWLLFTHANIAVSASSQTVGVNLTSSPNVNVNGSGTANLTYDPLTPGTPQALSQGSPPRALDIDINGAGGSNTPVNFDLLVNNLNINTSLGTFQLKLTIDAAITDLTFQSSAGSAATPGYLVPGDLTAVLNGAVNAQLVSVPILGTVNLGTIYNLVNAPLTFGIPLPGTATLSDPDAGPFPHDLAANFAFSLAGLSIPFPFTQPLNIAQTATVPNGQSGFSSLNVNAVLNATITLSNVAYSYNGTVANVLVPEPGTALLLGAGLAGLAGFARRRAA